MCVAQLIDCLSNTYKDLGSSPSTTQNCETGHGGSCLKLQRSGRERQDAGQSDVQGHLQLYSEHKASLGYKRTPQKKKESLQSPKLSQQK